MINRKTALICVALIALMLVAAVWRFTAIEDSMIPAVGSRPPLQSLMLFVFPGSSAVMVAALYWTRAKADGAKLLPWYRWGKFVAICYCSGLVLLQGIVVAQSFGLHMPWWIGSIIGAAMMFTALLAINQTPKLPWFERRLAPGGDLGPIYGPRYVRIQSRIVVVFLIVVFACSLPAPQKVGLAALPCIFLAAALLVIWSLAWRWHLGRKWSLEQPAAHGTRS